MVLPKCERPHFASPCFQQDYPEKCVFLCEKEAEKGHPLNREITEKIAVWRKNCRCGPFFRLSLAINCLR